VGVSESVATRSRLEHCALLYAKVDEYLAGARAFLQRGDADGERLMAAVPSPRLGQLQSALAEIAERITFVDMREVGRNPARIIPAVRDWMAAGGRRWRVFGEPLWPERPGPAVVETHRHEALVNVAFADAPASMLCAYDISLAGEAVACAERTHPELLRGGSRERSSRFANPLDTWRMAARPLPEPQRTLATLELGEDLAAMRRVVRRCARQVGLDEERAADLVLAADEAVANALQYGAGTARLQVWVQDRRIVCEVADRGVLDEPLAGRVRPTSDSIRGRGLWVVNQLCDLVELRPGPLGTRIRMHMDLPE
jgi:anti-sigma regulatory factor (Ser/Thr protein kinase)